MISSAATLAWDERACWLITLQKVKKNIYEGAARGLVSVWGSCEQWVKVRNRQREGKKASWVTSSPKKVNVFTFSRWGNDCMGLQSSRAVLTCLWASAAHHHKVTDCQDTHTCTHARTHRMKIHCRSDKNPSLLLVQYNYFPSENWNPGDILWQADNNNRQHGQISNLITQSVCKKSWRWKFNPLLG